MKIVFNSLRYIMVMMSPLLLLQVGHAGVTGIVTGFPSQHLPKDLDSLNTVESLQAERTKQQKALSAAKQNLESKKAELISNPNYASLNAYYKRAMDLNISLGKVNPAVFEARANWLEATFNKMKASRGQETGANDFDTWYRQNYSAIESNYIETLAHARHRVEYLKTKDEGTVRSINSLFTRISAAEAKIDKEFPVVLPWLNFVVASEGESATTPGTKSVLMYGEGNHWKVLQSTNTSWWFTCNNNLSGDPSSKHYKACVVLPYNDLVKPENKCADANGTCSKYDSFVASSDGKQYALGTNTYKCPSSGPCYSVPMSGPFKSVYDNFVATWPRVKQ